LHAWRRHCYANPFGIGSSISIIVTMNWKLIFTLSLFGLAMGLATVFVIPSSVEPVFWLVIFLVCAYVIAKLSKVRPFLHGLLLGLVNSIWITLSHIVFFGPYLATHPQEAQMMQTMPLPNAPQLMMAMTGPVVGLVTGFIIGILSLIAWRLVRRQNISANRSAA